MLKISARRWAAGTPVLSKARREVLDLVATHGVPLTVGELATLTGTHLNTVRGHLDALVTAGLVARGLEEAVHRGRPAWLYRPTAAVRTDERSYAALAGALAGQIERSANPREQSIGAGEQWGRAVAHDVTPVKDTLGQVVTLLDELGFNPDPQRADGRVRLRSCPLLDVALQHPDVVCGVHLGMVRGILKTVGGDPDSAELLAFYEPDACQLRVEP